MHGFLTAAVLLLVLAISTNHVDARAGGAPSAACRDMRPQHGNSNGVDPVPYTVATNVGPSYNFSTTYTVTISGPNFRGFLCQARNASGGSISPGLGTFTTVPGTQHLNCISALPGTNPTAAITHLDRLNGLTGVPSLSFNWTSPSTPSGTLEMRCSVVTSFSTFYVQIPSASFSEPVVPENTTFAPTVPITTLAPSSDLGNQDLLAGCLSTPPTKFCFRMPPACTGVSDCNYIYTHQVIGSDLSVELFGTTTGGEGWVAIGYSEDRIMGNDNVLGCEFEANGGAVAKNLRNNGRSSATHPNGVNAFLSGVTALRTGSQLLCRMQRPLATGADGDFDLTNPLTYFYGFRLTGSGDPNGPLGDRHTGIPVISTDPVRADSTGAGAASAVDREAVKAHGILMVLAWVGTAGTGIFLAAFMRQAWVDKPYWFLAHRIIMVSVWLLTLTSFILIFVHVDGFTTYTSHAGVGIATFVLTFVQPFTTLFRCAPDDDKRWIFNVIHHFIGYSTLSLGLAAVYIGLVSYEDLGFNIKSGARYTWIVWVAVSNVIWLAFVFYLCYFSPKGDAESSKDVEMKEAGDKGEPAKSGPKLAADYKLRRGVFVVYLLLAVACCLSVVIHIGVADNNPS